MKQVLIFGGTSEGRALAGMLCQAQIPCTVCVATEYGEQVMEAMLGLRLHQGRMDAEKIREFAGGEEYLAVVDATHPFAVEVSHNIREGLSGLTVPLYRLKRDTQENGKNGENGVLRCDAAGETADPIGSQGTGFAKTWFTDMEACAAALCHTPGNILLTTGSRDLAVFCRPQLRERLYVRVLPGSESIALCEKLGVCGRQIIAMQGPFSAGLNEALIRELQISCLVTKESGRSGGYFEKLKAAQAADIPVFIVGNPEKEVPGCSFGEVIAEISRLTGCHISTAGLRISLVGMGMGSEDFLTVAAKEELRQADVCFGAKRLLADLPDGRNTYPFYLAEDILPRLLELASRRAEQGGLLRAAILFSGDTGFYSGAQKLLAQLQADTELQALKPEICVYPGISSISCLSARTGISWNDAAVLSIHGRQADVLDTVRHSFKTFLLLSGVEDMHRVGEMLVNAGLTGVRVLAGYHLSYPEEEILTLTPEECMALHKEGLYSCLILNDVWQSRRLTHGMADTAFIRDKVPMTKEEVREISICKLMLTEDAVLYDVGSGTGSVAVECARLSPRIRVYAIEKKPEAAQLIRSNCRQYGCSNVVVVEDGAPEGFRNLPVPTHAFIGGSGGRMKEILGELYQKNPDMRVVVNAVTLETAAELTGLLAGLPVEQEDIVQVQVSRARKAGAYHLMQAENPVYVTAFRFRGSSMQDGAEQAGK